MNPTRGRFYKGDLMIDELFNEAGSDGCMVVRGGSPTRDWPCISLMLVYLAQQEFKEWWREHLLLPCYWRAPTDVTILERLARTLDQDQQMMLVDRVMSDDEWFDKDGPFERLATFFSEICYTDYSKNFFRY